MNQLTYLNGPMRKLLLILMVVGSVSALKVSAQSYENPKNHQCLKCHAFQSYTFHNDLMDREETRLMNPYFIMDTIAMRNGVHHGFDCTDCHSYEYSTYPHKSTLKLEPKATCLDCHGGDESFASYHFEEIDQEFKKSVHYKAYGDIFTCSKCHDQHTYKPIARNSSNVLDIVQYSNKMCLSCHNDMKRYEMVAGHANPKLVQVHSWLPNQELHFSHVRCIECHTQVSDSLNVSHDILPKSQAVRNCVECHSSNSRLKATLYKYENIRKRASGKILGTIISNESYVIGTNQVPLLKVLSIIIFLLALAGIVTHAIFRILKK